MAARSLQVFTTEELTTLLGLDPKKDKRRVIKFAESREYGIVPSIKLASGSGSRRLYDLENVCEFALALHLLRTGLRSQVIGQVIRDLRKKEKLSAKLELVGTRLQKLKLLMARESEPPRPPSKNRDRLISFQEGGDDLSDIIASTFCNSIGAPDLLLIPIGQTFSDLKDRLYRLRSEWAMENL